MSFTTYIACFAALASVLAVLFWISPEAREAWAPIIAGSMFITAMGLIVAEATVHNEPPLRRPNWRPWP